MKHILEYVEHKTQAFAQLPFLMFLQDESIGARQRLSFAPAMAPFAMGFSDVNKFSLRDESSSDPVQQAINTHSREDERHWGMYLRDLRTLGLNTATDMVTALRLLWGDDRKKTRQVVYGLTALIEGTSPAMRMAIVEAIESTGAVASKAFCKVAADFQKETGQELFYYGDLHASRESGHAQGVENVEDALAAIQLTPEEEQHAKALVDRVFQLFCDMLAEWHDYAQKAIRQEQRAAAESVRAFTPALAAQAGA